MLLHFLNNEILNLNIKYNIKTRG